MYASKLVDVGGPIPTHRSGILVATDPMSSPATFGLGARRSPIAAPIHSLLPGSVRGFATAAAFGWGLRNDAPKQEAVLRHCPGEVLK